MLKITNNRGEWLEKTSLLNNYAYQLFLNDYKYTENLMSQDRFIELSDLDIISINGKRIDDYYHNASLIIRKDKLEKISE